MNKEGINYCIIGGLAVNFYGYTRFTEDIDIFIESSEENIEKLKKVFKKIFEDEEIEKISLKDFENYAVIRYGSPEGIYIDLISRFGEKISWKDIAKDITYLWN